MLEHHGLQHEDLASEQRSLVVEVLVDVFGHRLLGLQLLDSLLLLLSALVSCLPIPCADLVLLGFGAAAFVPCVDGAAR